jgi:hypothetical protein
MYVHVRGYLAVSNERGPIDDGVCRYDSISLERHVKANLNILAYDDIRFQVNSSRIYETYPRFLVAVNQTVLRDLTGFAEVDPVKDPIQILVGRSQRGLN